MNDALLSDWLRAREREDWRSRSELVMQAVAAQLPQTRPINVLDLATGEGSNLRYLLPRVPNPQRWLLVDRSAALLSNVEERTRAWTKGRDEQVESLTSGFAISGPQTDCHVTLREHDLGTLDDGELFAGCDLVTASALLDLVSERWLRQLAAHCRHVSAVALFTLTYDGRSSCDPVEPEDETIRKRLNQHQLRDKGLGGPAEGPEASAVAIRCFTDAGYHVSAGASDWTLGPGQPEMQRILIDGWARAAAEAAPDDAEWIASWHARRLEHLRTGESRITVGHQDFAAWLA